MEYPDGYQFNIPIVGWELYTVQSKIRVYIRVYNRIQTDNIIRSTCISISDDIHIVLQCL